MAADHELISLETYAERVAERQLNELELLGI
jgi:hypothetical protein